MSVKLRKKYTSQEIKDFRVKLRKNMTPEELKLWNTIGKRKLGIRIRPQCIIGEFIVDFYCHEARVVIEIDGDYHKNTIKYDKYRENYILNYGNRNNTRLIKLIRYSNNEINNDFDGVVEEIKEILFNRI